MGEPVSKRSSERFEGRKTWDPAQAEGPSGNKRGLECRYCGCKHFRVICARPTWGGRIMPQRECRQCRKRMSTWEGVGVS